MLFQNLTGFSVFMLYLSLSVVLLAILVLTFLLSSLLALAFFMIFFPVRHTSFFFKAASFLPPARAWMGNSWLSLFLFKEGLFPSQNLNFTPLLSHMKTPVLHPMQLVWGYLLDEVMRGRGWCFFTLFVIKAHSFRRDSFQKQGCPLEMFDWKWLSSRHNFLKHLPTTKYEWLSILYEYEGLRYCLFDKGKTCASMNQVELGKKLFLNSFHFWIRFLSLVSIFAQLCTVFWQCWSTFIYLKWSIYIWY